MLERIVFVFVILVSTWQVAAQSSGKDAVLNREIQIIADNDLFLFTYRDSYYSSGAFARYRRLLESGEWGATPPIASSHYLKSIVTFDFQHKMFTPFEIWTDYEPNIDRPYAGWADVGIGVGYYYLKAVLKSRVGLGWVGPATQTEHIQKAFHTVFATQIPRGWGEYQVDNRPSLQWSGSYMKKVLGNKNIDINGEGFFNLGTVRTVSGGALIFRWGFFNSLGNSALSGGKMGQRRKPLADIAQGYRTQELYVFFRTSVEKIVYDATIQGDLVGDLDQFKDQVEPIIYRRTWGLTRSGQHFDLSLSVHTMSAELIDGARHFYGTVSMSYRI